MNGISNQSVAVCYLCCIRLLHSDEKRARLKGEIFLVIGERVCFKTYVSSSVRLARTHLAYLTSEFQLANNIIESWCMLYVAAMLDGTIAFLW